MMIQVMMGPPEKNDEVGRNVEIKVIDADNKDQALTLTKGVMDLLAKDRLAVVRVWPVADTYRNFDSKTEQHNGYARFAVFDRKGEWRDSPSVVRLPTSTDGAAPVYAGRER